MENEEVKQYLIGFVEKTLNECEVFAKAYGKDFVRQRLEMNLDKVHTDMYSELYDGEYSPREHSIKISRGNKDKRFVKSRRY